MTTNQIETKQTGPFDNRDAQMELIWLGREVSRTFGKFVMQSGLDINDMDDPTVRHYRTFKYIADKTVEEMEFETGRDPSSYRNQFQEPDEDLWTGEVADSVESLLSEALENGYEVQFGEMTGVVRIPKEAAAEIGFDYDDEAVNPIFFPEVDGEVYDPIGVLPEFEIDEEPEVEEPEEDEEDIVAPWESDEPEEDESETEEEDTEDEPEPEPEPDTADTDDSTSPPSGPLESYIDFDTMSVTGSPETPEDLNRRELAVYLKVQDPSRSHQDVSEVMKELGIGYSSSSVGNALNNFLSEDQKGILSGKTRAARQSASDAGLAAGSEVAEKANEEQSQETETESEPDPTPEPEPEPTSPVETEKTTSAVEGEKTNTPMAALIDSVDGLKRKESTISVHKVLIGATASLADKGNDEAIRTLYQALMDLEVDDE
jgi:hypothetical protein